MVNKNRAERALVMAQNEAQQPAFVTRVLAAGMALNHHLRVKNEGCVVRFKQRARKNQN